MLAIKVNRKSKCTIQCINTYSVLHIITSMYIIYRVYNNVYISILNNNMYIYFKISENLPNLTIFSKNLKVK